MSVSLKQEVNMTLILIFVLGIGAGVLLTAACNQY